MFLRPCFLVVDREFAGSISTRKLVIETAKFNVITAYSIEEGHATMERFPNVHGIVINADSRGEAITFLREMKNKYPAVKRVLSGHSADEDGVANIYVDNYQPAKLLEAIRSLFPDDAATADRIEATLEENDG